MRSSKVESRHDEAGDYEIEIFDHPSPQRVIVCSHGNGVRRWDGEKFFYAVAEHYADCVVLLVDQNQPEDDGVRINPLPILVSRVSKLVEIARERYAGVPVVVMAHSMGCGVAALMEADGLNGMVFVAPAVGRPAESLLVRYGADVAGGKKVLTSDGPTKVITAEYYKSVQGISWEEAYAKLAARFHPVDVYEAGADEIVGEGRFEHRKIAFDSYTVIDGAPHNFVGASLAKLFDEMDRRFRSH
jgi:pimeloyl-ACP methyl ester carboxylesterase